MPTIIKGPDLFEDLPNDPELAFCEFERRVQRAFLSGQDDSSWVEEESYINHLLAFTDQFDLDIGVDLAATLHSQGSFGEKFREAKRQVEYFCTRVRLRQSSEEGGAGAGIFVLEPSHKSEIHHYLQQIRELIEESSLRAEKKEALFSRLDAFANEVNRDRTRVENLVAGYIWTKRELRDCAPALEKFAKIFDVLGKGKELFDALPRPLRRKTLSAPPKRLQNISEQNFENFSTDEEDPPF